MKRFILLLLISITAIQLSAQSKLFVKIPAGETGPHQNNRSSGLTDHKRNKGQEITDIFAGEMLYNLGSPLREIHSAINNVSEERESNIHTPGHARIETVTSRWQQPKDKSPMQPERIVLPDNDTMYITDTIDPLGLLPIPGGIFTIGCTDEQQSCFDDEKPIHQVELSDFYLGKYEVTQQLWREIMGSDPKELAFPNCDQCPVEHVDWDDAQEFIKNLNAKYPGWNYRLPTEAEWEYAAREGGKSILFGNGKNILDPSEANFDASFSPKKSYAIPGINRQKTTPVGSFAPNKLGLFDMSGNVWEWCSDWIGGYNPEYQKNPTGPEYGFNHVIRGGSWYSPPSICRVALREEGTLGGRSICIGFRIARTK